MCARYVRIVKMDFNVRKTETASVKDHFMATVIDPFLVNSTQLDQTYNYEDAIGTSLNTRRF